MKNTLFVSIKVLSVIIIKKERETRKTQILDKVEKYLTMQ